MSGSLHVEGYAGEPGLEFVSLGLIPLPRQRYPIQPPRVLRTSFGNEMVKYWAILMVAQQTVVAIEEL